MSRRNRKCRATKVTVEDMVRYTRDLFNEDVMQVHMMCFAMADGMINNILTFNREEDEDYIRKVFQEALVAQLCPIAYLVTYRGYGQCNLLPWVWQSLPGEQAERIHRDVAKAFAEFVTGHTCTPDCHHDSPPQRQYVN